jgi:Dolichol-phosphate mannosyltransferase subunit 3 (DPM3)
MALLRYQLFLCYGLGFGAVWYQALQHLDAVRSTEAEAATPLSPWINVAVVFAPLWVLVGLGVYAVASIAIGVSNFRDCPEAAIELDKQVQEAKAEMKRREIIG